MGGSGGSEAAEKGRVRVVLFRECERRGRKLLFDSSSVERVDLTGEEVGQWTEVGEGEAYRYLPPCGWVTVYYVSSSFSSETLGEFVR